MRMRMRLAAAAAATGCAARCAWRRRPCCSGPQSTFVGYYLALEAPRRPVVAQATQVPTQVPHAAPQTMRTIALIALVGCTNCTRSCSPCGPCAGRLASPCCSVCSKRCPPNFVDCRSSWAWLQRASLPARQAPPPGAPSALRHPRRRRHMHVPVLCRAMLRMPCQLQVPAPPPHPLSLPSLVCPNRFEGGAACPVSRRLPRRPPAT